VVGQLMVRKLVVGQLVDRRQLGRSLLGLRAVELGPQR
jgi:hypothetical protein